MAMTRAQLAKMLQDGLNTVFGLNYDQWAEEYSQFMDVQNSKKAFEEDVLLAGLGYAAEKQEGGAYAEDEGQEVWTKRYTHRTLGLSFRLTEEAIEDNRYMEVGSKYAAALARSMRQSEELYSANVLNRSYTGGYTGGDGELLLSTSHPLAGGGTASNMLATAADLSESSLEDALIIIRKLKDDRGLPVMIKPTKLLVAPDNEYNARRIIGSVNRPDTANNDINAVNSKGIFGSDPTVITNMTDTDMWLIKTDCPDGLKFMSRTKLVTPKATVDSDTGNIVYRARRRFSEGWTDWRGIVGSSGAA